jgi:hypothetical protein
MISPFDPDLDRHASLLPHVARGSGPTRWRSCPLAQRRRFFAMVRIVFLTRGLS